MSELTSTTAPAVPLEPAMPADRYVVRRTYSSISPPPLRGYVLWAVPTDDPDESQRIEIDRFPILGVVVCTESRWVRRDSSLERITEDPRQLTTQQLAEDSFVPDGEYSRIVPVIHYNPCHGEPDSDDHEERTELTILSESTLKLDHFEVVWCTWGPEVDERRLEPAVQRLRRRAENRS